jgi:hypothetical protein
MRYTDADDDSLTCLALDLMRSWSHSPDEWMCLPGEALPVEDDELGDIEPDALEAASDLDVRELIRAA